MAAFNVPILAQNIASFVIVSRGVLIREFSLLAVTYYRIIVVIYSNRRLYTAV